MEVDSGRSGFVVFPDAHDKGDRGGVGGPDEGGERGEEGEEECEEAHSCSGDEEAVERSGLEDYIWSVRMAAERYTKQHVVGRTHPYQSKGPI